MCAVKNNCKYQMGVSSGLRGAAICVIIQKQIMQWWNWKFKWPYDSSVLSVLSVNNVCLQMWKEFTYWQVEFPTSQLRSAILTWRRYRPAVTPSFMSHCSVLTKPMLQCQVVQVMKPACCHVDTPASHRLRRCYEIWRTQLPVVDFTGSERLVSDYTC